MTCVRSRLLLLAAIALAAPGCGVLDKKPAKTPVAGERVSVLDTERDVQPDDATAALPMSLPAPVRNEDWVQSGGNAAKSMGHLDLPSQLGPAWSVSIGEGSSARARLVSAPVVAGGRVFTIDTRATVRAFDLATGREVWAVQFGADRGNERSLYGGGVAFDNGRIYATNGLGYVAALDAGTGGIAWQKQPGGPVRGAPTVAAGAVYVLSQDNQIYSLNAGTGDTNWSAAAALEIAGVFGTAAPAFAQGTVVAGFSSGELNAYRYENGRVVWQDALQRTTARTGVSILSDIDADPVIDGGQVVALGQGGRMVALELISGQRIWELNIAGISTPWVVGPWAFVVTDDSKLIAVSRENGRVRWINQLRRFQNEKNKRGPISYAGPVLAGNRLHVVNSEGDIIAVDPASGTTLTQVNIRAPISLSPVVANGTLLILDDEGRLHAYR
jgi:outer membrane protein assembly factor BamB